MLALVPVLLVLPTTATGAGPAGGRPTTLAPPSMRLLPWPSVALAQLALRGWLGHGSPRL
eukprot:8473515-Pyramimonas_sp.AAC.1